MFHDGSLDPQNDVKMSKRLQRIRQRDIPGKLSAVNGKSQYPDQTEAESESRPARKSEKNETSGKESFTSSSDSHSSDIRGVLSHSSKREHEDVCRRLDAIHQPQETKTKTLLRDGGSGRTPHGRCHRNFSYVAGGDGVLMASLTEENDKSGQSRGPVNLLA